MNRPSRRTLAACGAIAVVVAIAVMAVLASVAGDGSPARVFLATGRADFAREYGAVPEPGLDAPIWGNFSVEQARRFDDYQLYYLGDVFEGLPLTAVDTRTVPATNELTGGRYVHVFSFVYGNCEVAEDDNPLPSEGDRCYPPLIVHNRPSCVYSLTLYSGKNLRPFRWIRGAAARFHDRLIMATGRTTLDFWTDRDLALRAAAGLVPVNRVESAPEGRLPPPELGTFQQKLRCGREVHPAG